MYLQRKTTNLMFAQRDQVPPSLLCLSKHDCPSSDRGDCYPPLEKWLMVSLLTTKVVGIWALASALLSLRCIWLRHSLREALSNWGILSLKVKTSLLLVCSIVCRWQHQRVVSFYTMRQYIHSSENSTVFLRWAGSRFVLSQTYQYQCLYPTSANHIQRMVSR